VGYAATSFNGYGAVAVTDDGSDGGSREATPTMAHLDLTALAAVTHSPGPGPVWALGFFIFFIFLKRFSEAGKGTASVGQPLTMTFDWRQL
jgi:hypothetical protein